MSRQNPCPICGKPDWCLVATDGSVAICPRTPSDRMAGSAGYIHDINPLITPNPLPLTVPEPEPCIDIDWQTGVDQAISRMENFMYEELTKQTGLSRQELQSMRVGWSIKKSAYTFPMRDHEGKTIGIRLHTRRQQVFCQGQQVRLVLCWRPTSQWPSADRRRSNRYSLFGRQRFSNCWATIMQWRWYLSVEDAELETPSSAGSR